MINYEIIIIVILITKHVRFIRFITLKASTENYRTTK